MNIKDIKKLVKDYRHYAKTPFVPKLQDTQEMLDKGADVIEALLYALELEVHATTCRGCKRFVTKRECKACMATNMELRVKHGIVAGLAIDRKGSK